MQLRLPPQLPNSAVESVFSVVSGLPLLIGSPIRVLVKPELTAHRGKLLSRKQTGTPVHAGGFIRERRIVLESQLFEDAARLRLVLTHELFHFVWARLGNLVRADFINLITDEFAGKARGELGESASVSKDKLLARGIRGHTQNAFRNYVCEAFCDTGAFLYSGVKSSEHFTLARRWTARRESWFQVAIDWKSKCF